MDGEERRVILEEWKGPGANYPEGASIPGLFAEMVERYADDIALSCDDRALTYRELHEEANRLANHLAAAGVGRGDRVALCVDRSIEHVVSTLAILSSTSAQARASSSPEM